MMPKPFFIFALAPGIITGEWFTHGWVREFVFFLTNSLAYGVVAFCVTTLIHASSRQA
jgi:hypothetical protein